MREKYEGRLGLSIRCRILLLPKHRAYSVKKSIMCTYWDLPVSTVAVGKRSCDVSDGDSPDGPQ